MLKYNFITFEGIEGSGKSTQARLLDDFLKLKNIPTLLTREPGGTKAAEEIRNLLIQGEIEKLDGITETLLNFAARRDHAEKLIKPALRNNQVVICDRFYDSTFAYQGFGHSVNLQSIQAIQKIAIGNFTPDITFLIDVEVEIVWPRIANRLENNRYEKMAQSFHHQVRTGFLSIAKEHPQRIKIIDGTKTIEQIHQEIISILQFHPLQD